jgi:hypothetical protein
MFLKIKSQKNSISKLILLAVLAAALGIWSDVVLAQDQVQDQTQIYGSQLMSATERTEYQLNMRSLKTDKERAAFRLDHHEKMKVRAAEKGITLPNTPLGVGPGSKAGTGIGAGQGLPANPSGASKGAGK